MTSRRTRSARLQVGTRLGSSAGRCHDRASVKHRIASREGFILYGNCLIIERVFGLRHFRCDLSGYMCLFVFWLNWYTGSVSHAHFACTVYSRRSIAIPSDATVKQGGQSYYTVRRAPSYVTVRRAPSYVTQIQLSITSVTWQSHPILNKPRNGLPQNTRSILPRPRQL
jgi:hypothetical protein